MRLKKKPAVRSKYVCPMCGGNLMNNNSSNPACYGECLEAYRTIQAVRVMSRALDNTARKVSFNG